MIDKYILKNLLKVYVSSISQNILRIKWKRLDKLLFSVYINTAVELYY